MNIDAGGRTKLSAVVHGVLLAMAVAFLPRAINMIPLSCLAAILIATGLKLASPKIFSEMWNAGRYQFVPYVTTLVAIMFSDPLIGILIGLSVSIAFILWGNMRRPTRLVVERHLSGEVTRIELANQVSFLNRAAIRTTFDAVPPGKHVLIDAHEAVYIDPDILQMIREYRDTIGPARGVHVSTRGFRSRYQIEDSIQFVDFSSRELQHNLTPAGAFSYLMAGNERFRTGQRISRDFGRQVVATSLGQHPVAVVLSCIDSRSPAELLFDLGLGDAFSVRVAGNIATDEVLGSIEFACAVAGAKVVVVLGHTRCGAVNAAVQATCNPGGAVAPDCVHLAPIVRSIGRSVDHHDCGLAANASAEQHQVIADRVARRTVECVVREILDSSAVIAGLVREGRLGIVGMMYDVQDGRAEVIPETIAGMPAVRPAPGSG